MTRRCSYCSHNGHNSRTCPNRGVKLFGVRLTDGSIRKSASMGNLTHYTGSSSGNLQNGLAGNNHDSPGDTPDHGVPPEMGMRRRILFPGRRPVGKERKSSVDIPMESHDFFTVNPQTETQTNPLPDPPALDEECESMDSTNSNDGEQLPIVLSTVTLLCFLLISLNSYHFPFHFGPEGTVQRRLKGRRHMKCLSPQQYIQRAQLMSMSWLECRNSASGNPLGMQAPPLSRSNCSKVRLVGSRLSGLILAQGAHVLTRSAIQSMQFRTLSQDYGVLHADGI